jgi:hypothetical protein
MTQRKKTFQEMEEEATIKQDKLGALFEMFGDDIREEFAKRRKDKDDNRRRN